MLRKIVAILFIKVYLLSLAGYSILFDYFIHQTNKHTVQELDNGNYNESELFEIKVPLHLPYYTSLDEYERYDGGIELNGIHYNFVKRKIHNDTLYLLCLPNHVKTELYKAKNDLAAEQSDNEPFSSQKGTESSGKKNNCETEFNLQYPLYILLPASLPHTGRNIYSCRLTTCFIAFPAKPPEII
ncbi:MAG: hypothetical protein SFU87_13425 [Chitinophagaceae bacterium]|nr:hypothetical protein [Chitinophagaceae bacterium]